LVELKSKKRISRHDEITQDDWAWIELHSVRAHDKGWLLSSMADFICFERTKCFEFYKRTELKDRVLSLVDFTKKVNSPEEARYAVYSRRGRLDKLTLVEYSKFNDLCKGSWPKRK